jgi:arylsulfatase A
VRIFFALTIFALTAFVLPGLSPDDAGAAERPNFLVILCDDLGYGDLACYGHPTIKTPHLDKLAGEGWRLTDCYSAAPVCSSSRAGLLTGRTPSRVGVYNWIPGGNIMHLPASEVTIAQLLGQAGYDTALVGKWHCNGKFNSPAQPQPDDAGFDHWFATQNNAAPSHRDPKNFVRNGQRVGATSGFSSHVVAREGIEWLGSREDKSKPFYLQVCFHEPHEPIDSPEDLVGKYREAGATKKGEALYYANVENLDAAVGKLMQALDQMQLADNTLVFFTSDNGPETLDRYQSAWRSHGTPGPLRGMKLWMYDGGIRVCGIMRFPGHTKAGEEPRVPIASLDLLPTFCELAGVQVPQDRTLDGTSLTPLFDGQSLARAQPLFWHYYNALGDPKLAMRDGDYMLVANVDQGSGGASGGGFRPEMMPLIKQAEPTTYELYHVVNDIAQEHDLAQDEPERTAAMAAALNKIWTSVKAEGPDWREE